MNRKEFYRIYLPALNKAFKEDDGILIPDPERYVGDKELCRQISIYIDQIEGDDFVDKVGYYLDARTHNFPSIEGVDIKDYRLSIIEEMKQLEKIYLSND